MCTAELYHQDNMMVLPILRDNTVQIIYNDILFGTDKHFGDYKDISVADVDLFYRCRLSHMRSILKDTGLLYIHTDYHISHMMKLLLDDIFGPNNFRNEIIWYFNSGHRKKYDFGRRHHTIFRYSKTDTYVFNPIRTPYAKSAPRGYAKERYYHKEGKVIDDVWCIGAIGQNDKTERVGYATQKPVQLLDRIICSSSNEGDIVADFFLGSGTTAVSALKNRRNFIGCDINARSIEITKKRIEQYEKGSAGFKA